MIILLRCRVHFRQLYKTNV